MSSHYAELRPTSGWDQLAVLGHPSKFQLVLRLCFVTASISLNGGQPNFARCLAIFWAGLIHYIYIFWELLPPNRTLPGAKFTASKSCVLLYWQHYCTALNHWVSAKLCGVHQRAPPIFRMAAITLGIGPHSSCWCCCCRLQKKYHVWINTGKYFMLD